MASRAVVDKDLGFDAIMEDMQKIHKLYVTVGIQQGSKTIGEKKGDREQEPDVDIATYAAFNEFGDGVPERSFMRSTFDERKDEFNRFIQKSIGRVIDQKIDVETALNASGLFIQEAIQKKIVDLKEPPNSIGTILKKGSSNPLIDFGAMVNAVRYAIKRRR